MSIELKYCITYYRNCFIARICVNDHKCAIRGCKIDIDNKFIKVVTIPFDYTKTIKGRYWIEMDFDTEVIKQGIDFTINTDAFVKLDKQFEIQKWR